MDITVKPIGPTSWSLVDLLGREMGRVEEDQPGDFRISPGERVAKSMQTMKHGPFKTLDLALSEIETFTRGTCRRVSADDDTLVQPKA